MASLGPGDFSANGPKPVLRDVAPLSSRHASLGVRDPCRECRRMPYSISDKSARSWISSVGLAVAVGIAYFLAARLVFSSSRNPMVSPFSGRPRAFLPAS